MKLSNVSQAKQEKRKNWQHDVRQTPHLRERLGISLKRMFDIIYNPSQIKESELLNLAYIFEQSPITLCCRYAIAGKLKASRVQKLEAEWSN